MKVNTDKQTYTLSHWSM